MYFQLKNIELNLHLGVPEEERETKQKVLVSVFFEVETQKAEISDDVEDTVNYQIIYDIIQAFEKKSEKKAYKLLEKLHRDLKNEINSKKLKITDLEIYIEKMPFPTGKIIISD